MATLQSLLSKYESLKSAWEKKNLSECGKLLAEFKVQLLLHWLLSLANLQYFFCFRIAGGAGQMWKWGRVSSD